MSEGLQKQEAPIRILLVDDHPVWRQGLQKVFSLTEDLEVVGEVAAGDEALRECAQLQPDVVLLDVNIPKINGIQVTTRLKTHSKAPAVIVLTGHDDVEQAIHAIRAGAMGYCSKDVEPDTLMDGIRQVIQGVYFVRGKLFDKAGVEDWVKAGIASLGPHYVADGQEHFMPLTRREMQILRSVTHGRSNQEIAYRLHISHQTVKNHMTSILRKLDVQDRTQAAVYALAHGWVRLDEPEDLSDLDDEEKD